MEEIVEQIVFSDQQKAHIEAQMKERLERQQRVHDAAQAQITAEMEARVKQAQAEAASADAFLKDSARKDEAAANERLMLGKYFGPGSSSAEASRLHRESPETYRQLRVRAQAAGLVARDKVSVGSSVTKLFNQK